MSSEEHLFARVRARFDAWREEPWDLKPWHNASAAYRRWVVCVVASQLAIAAVLFSQLGFVYSAPDHVLLILVIVGPLALRMSTLFRTSDTSTSAAELGAELALIFSGHAAEALLCSLVGIVAEAVRKPLPAHLIAVNAINAFGQVTVAAAVFVGAGAGAVPLSPDWAIVGILSYAAYAALAGVGIYGTSIVGGYLAFREAAESWLSDTYSDLLSVVPLALLTAGMLSYPSPWNFFFLVTPVLIGYEMLRRLRTISEVQEDASTDPLTGLHNRRSFQERLEHMLVDRRSGPGWVVLCDLDHFKRLNDTLGHEAGDEALRTAAQCMRNSVRTQDMCVRYGGEELLVLMSGIDETGVAAAVERIRANIEYALSRYGSSVSIGVHRLQLTDSVMSAVNAADEALYYSKQTGRNRVSFTAASLNRAA